MAHELPDPASQTSLFHTSLGTALAKQVFGRFGVSGVSDASVFRSEARKNFNTTILARWQSWSIASVLKSDESLSIPWVRIPLSPLFLEADDLIRRSETK